MAYPLHCIWNGEHFHLFSTKNELSNSNPLTLSSVSEELTIELGKVFESQELVQYQVSSLPIKLYYLGEETVTIPVSYRISGLGFLDLITSLKDELLEHYTFGNSIIFWKQASKVLLDALARGLFYPSIIHKGSQKISNWELYLQDPILQDLITDLSFRMPFIANQCSLVSISNLSQITGEDFNRSSIISFFKVSLNETIRSFLGNFSFLEVKDSDRKDNSFIKQKSVDLDDNSKIVVNKKDLSLVSWLESLSKVSGKLELTAVELSLLERKILDWNERLRGRVDEFRPKLTIEVTAPEIQQGEDPFQKDWHLSIYFDQDAIEKNKSSYDIDEAQKTEIYDYLMLRDLGKLQEILPFFTPLLNKGVFSDYRIDAEQAYEILEKYKKNLEEEHYIVKAPDWWNEAKKAVGVVVKIKSKDELKADTPFAGTNLVDFSWKLTIGGEELSLEQFEQVLDQGRSLIYVGGKWVGLDRNEIKDNILKLKTLSSTQKFTLFDALRLGVSGLTGMTQLDLVRIDADGWIQKILDFNKDESTDKGIPEIFKGELRPYQSVGVSWLSFLSQVGVGGCLADDMGLGKTVQVLALLSKELVADASLSPNLLVVPMSIVGNWEMEAKKFVPNLKVYVHHGPSRLIGPAFIKAVKDSTLVVTTYNLLHRDYKHFRKIQWYRIILDEAQNIKNTEAKQTKAVRALVEELSRDNAGKDANQSSIEVIDKLPNNGRGPLRLALTGTPLENRLQELWSILDFINPGLLGTSEDFRKQFVNPIEKTRDMSSANSLGRLIKPFILRRAKTDPEIAADLPEKIEMENFVHLTAEQAGLYSATLEQMMPKVRELEGIHRKGIILSVITKLKQICIHPSLALKDGAPLGGRSGKLQVLEELLDTILAEGDRVLIFTQFAQWGELLSPYLSEMFNVKVPFFHGGLSRGDREKIIGEFQSDDGPPILVLSLKAGGFGLNLTRANQVIHMDQWWNPAVQNQATDRAYRIGQKSTVQVRSLISKGTLEEKINQLHKEKLELANAVVGTTRNVITELSPEALEELLSLQTSVLLES